jgi:hypothetical protein
MSQFKRRPNCGGWSGWLLMAFRFGGMCLSQLIPVLAAHMPKPVKSTTSSRFSDRSSWWSPTIPPGECVSECVRLLFKCHVSLTCTWECLHCSTTYWERGWGGGEYNCSVLVLAQDCRWSWMYALHFSCLFYCFLILFWFRLTGYTWPSLIRKFVWIFNNNYRYSF